MSFNWRCRRDFKWRYRPQAGAAHRHHSGRDARRHRSCGGWSDPHVTSANQLRGPPWPLQSGGLRPRPRRGPWRHCSRPTVLHRHYSVLPSDLPAPCSHTPTPTHSVWVMRTLSTHPTQRCSYTEYLKTRNLKDTDTLTAEAQNLQDTDTMTAEAQNLQDTDTLTH